VNPEMPDAKRVPRIPPVPRFFAFSRLASDLRGVDSSHLCCNRSAVSRTALLRQPCPIKTAGQVRSSVYAQNRRVSPLQGCHRPPISEHRPANTTIATGRDTTANGRRCGL